MNTQKEISIGWTFFWFILPLLLRDASTAIIQPISIFIINRYSFTDYHLITSACAVYNNIFSFIALISGFFCYGTISKTSRLIGTKKDYEVYTNFARTLFIGICIASLIVMLQSPIKMIFLNQLNNLNSSIVEDADVYYSIRIYKTIPDIAILCFYGWFFGMQKTKFPAIITVIFCFTFNISEIILATNGGLNLKSHAITQLIFSFLELALCIVCMVKYFPEVKKHLSFNNIFDKKQLIEFAKFNIPLPLDKICKFTGTLLLFYSFKKFNHEIIIIRSVSSLAFIYNIFSNCSYIFSYATIALCGKFYGEGNMALFRKAIYKITLFHLCFAVLLACICYTYSGIWIEALAEYGITDISKLYIILFLTILIIFAEAILSILEGAVIGSGKSTALLLSSLIGFLLSAIICLALHNISLCAFWLTLLIFTCVKSGAIYIYITKKIKTNLE